jgi:hypothetical protein
MDLDKPSQKPSELEEGSGTADERIGQAPPLIPPSVTAMQVPPSPNGDSKSEKKQRDCFDYMEIGIQSFGILVLLAYTTFAAFQWCAMKKAAQAAKESADTASRQLEMEDRPWLKDTVRSGSDFIFQNNNTTVSWAVLVRAENVGHSVATAIYPEAKLITIRGADCLDGPRHQVTQLCDNLSKRFEAVKSDPSVWGNSVFPGDSTEIPLNVFLGPSDIGSTSIDGGRGLGKSIFPMLIGCVEYHYATSEKPHFTGFVYVLSHTDDPAVPTAAQVFFSIGKNVPKADIMFTKSAQYAY